MVNTYKIYRDNSLINSNAISPYTDAGLTNGQQYAYQVSAVNVVGEGPKSNVVNVTPSVGSWFGLADPWAGISFLSHPTSATISINGGTDVEISNKTFQNQTGQNVVSISLQNITGYWIHDVDFDTITEAIFAQNCTNGLIERARARNIVGPSVRDGSHRGNFYQFGDCTNYIVRDVKVKGGDTEDIFSNYRSGGTSGNPAIIERFALEGTNWSSGSGTGCILGDGPGGNYTTVRNFTMLTPGQVGLNIIAGIGHKVYNGILYSAMRPGQTSPNVGVATYTPYAGNCPTAEIYNLQVRWYKNSGAESPYWWDPRCAAPNEHNNDWHAAINSASLAVVF